MNNLGNPSTGITSNKAGLGGAISKVKARPSAKRLAERKADV